MIQDKRLIELEITDMFGEFSIEQAKQFYECGLKHAKQNVKFYKRMLKTLNNWEEAE